LSARSFLTQASLLRDQRRRIEAEASRETRNSAYQPQAQKAVKGTTMSANQGSACHEAKKMRVLGEGEEGANDEVDGEHLPAEVVGKCVHAVCLPWY
jgi:hypothetical protein